jgi:predicted TIM-barrel fold metal-dependent hydrolase
MSQVLFGSDYPYLRRDLAVACRHEVATSPELAPEEGRAVLASNALNLFPRLSAQMERSSKRSILANRTKEP